jgi:hypothetical protein
VRNVLLSISVVLALVGCGGEREADVEQAGSPETFVDPAQESQRIEVGMTEAQVVEILGEPRARVGEGSGQRLTFWAFDAQQKVRSRVYVSLDADGTVVNVETIPL